VRDWYDSINEEGKNLLRIMKTSTTIFKTLFKEIKIEFIGAKPDFKESAVEWQGKINNIEFYDIRYLKKKKKHF